MADTFTLSNFTGLTENGAASTGSTLDTGDLTIRSLNSPRKDHRFTNAMDMSLDMAQMVQHLQPMTQP
jgi:hypothetical protein